MFPVFITPQNEVFPIMDQRAIASLTYIMVNVLAVFSKNIIHSLHYMLSTSYEYMYYIVIYSLMAYLFYTLILLIQLENKINMRHLTVVNEKSK